MIPIGHDRQVTRSLPMVTIILIALNCVVFIIQAVVTPAHDRVLDASLDQLVDFTTRYPQARLTDTARDRLERVPDFYLRSLRAAVSADLRKGTAVDQAVDARSPQKTESSSVIQAETTRRCDSFVRAYDTNFNLRFGFIPRTHAASPFNYISNLFLHGSWEHLAGNMLCLFVVGIALEDTWGGLVYLLFYLAGGVFATATHWFSAPSNKVVCMGASGAIAALMGAFLVRHFSTRIKLFVFVAVIRVPAYLYFPFMVGLDIRNSFVRHAEDVGGVALWAHIGGFTFGAVLSALIYYSSLEKLFAPRGGPTSMSFGTGSALEEAKHHLEEGDYVEAIRKLKQRVESVPADLSARRELARCFGRMGDLNGARTALLGLIQLGINRGELESALRAYSDYLDSYEEGETVVSIPALPWERLCRHLSERGMLAEAAGEYEKLVRDYPQHADAAELLIEAAVCRERLADDEYARLLLRRARESRDLNPALLLRLPQRIVDFE